MALGLSGAILLSSRQFEMLGELVFSLTLSFTDKSINLKIKMPKMKVCYELSKCDRMIMYFGKLSPFRRWEGRVIKTVNNRGASISK